MFYLFYLNCKECMYNQVYFNFGKRLPFKSVALEKVTVHTVPFFG